MIGRTLGQVAAITGGRLGGGARADQYVPGPVEFDSRRVRPGGLFLALAGERADGHDFAAAAVADGAVAVLVTRPVDAPHVLVDDGLAALSALAADSVRRRDDLVVIGITGSAGKTSTKDLLGALLERLGPTLAPRESFNNELGHPYTVLQAEAQTRYLVLELSARGVGHIAELARIAPPRIGVVLNVGSAHIGEFGSRAAIARAKGELVEALPAADAGGVAVLNADDPAVAAMSDRTEARVVTFGESAGATIAAEAVTVDDSGRAAFRLRTPAGSSDVRLGLVGRHLVSNALAAVAVAVELGLDLDTVVEVLRAAQPRSRSRMAASTRSDGVTVIDDAYNANPESMRAALATLTGIGNGRTTWAVLGYMAELGEETGAAHRSIGAAAVQLGVRRLVVVGAEARELAVGAQAALASSGSGRPDAEVGTEVTWVPDQADAFTLLHRQLATPDVVMFKASRSVGLDRLAARIREDAPGSRADESGSAGTDPTTGEETTR